MENVKMNSKGFSVEFPDAKQRGQKRFTPLQKKCMNVLLETNKFITAVNECEETKQMETVLYQIFSLQVLLPSFTKQNNDDLMRLQLRALKDYLDKVDQSVIPRSFLKTFLAYRKLVIERIGRV